LFGQQKTNLSSTRSRPVAVCYDSTLPLLLLLLLLLLCTTDLQPQRIRQ
jgi:hypothetical protein